MTLFQNILSSGYHFDKKASDTKFKYLFTNIFFILAILVIIINVFDFYIPQVEAIFPYFYGLHVAAGIYFFLALILLRIRQSIYGLLLFFALTFSIVLFTLSLFFHYTDHTSLIWFSIPILLSIVLSSKWTQIYIILLTVLILGYYLLYMDPHFKLNQITIQESLILIIIFVAYTIVMKLKYEEDRNDLQHLYQTLSKKNHELEKLNSTLDQRVEDEIQKSVEKDQYILRQSRLAHMGDVVNILAHQWRQPLGAISANVANMQMALTLDESDPNQCKNSLNSIEKTTQELSKTIRNFQIYFKLDNKLTSISLTILFEKIYKLFNDKLAYEKIRWEHHAPEALKLVNYESDLFQVLVSLVQNSFEAIAQHQPAHPEIILNAYEENAFVVIEIKDNAKGLKASVIEHIFEPYFSTKEAKNGTGLGLFSAKITIEKHCQGTISIENSENGAKVTITLPLSIKEVA